jgi:putative sterol carrier protein
MERLAKLRTFGHVSAPNWRAGLENVAAELSSSALSGQLMVTVVGTERRTLLIDLDEHHAHDLTESLEVRDPMHRIAVWVKEDSLNAILRGELSPLEALLRGSLRYAGDEVLGVAILRQLAVTEDAVFEPCRDESW